MAGSRMDIGGQAFRKVLESGIIYTLPMHTFTAITGYGKPPRSGGIDIDQTWNKYAGISTPFPNG